MLLKQPLIQVVDFKDQTARSDCFQAPHHSRLFINVSYTDPFALKQIVE